MLRWVPVPLRVCEGTGHGVGAFLNVHEGPHGISSTIRKGPMMEIGLVPGMVVSNEPGYATSRCYVTVIHSYMYMSVSTLPHTRCSRLFLSAAVLHLADGCYQYHLIPLSSVTSVASGTMRTASSASASRALSPSPRRPLRSTSLGRPSTTSRRCRWCLSKRR